MMDDPTNVLISYVSVLIACLFTIHVYYIYTYIFIYLPLSFSFLGLDIHCALLSGNWERPTTAVIG